MEKIQNGMLEMMQYIAATQMNQMKFGKLDVQGSESEFGKLLEQKSNVDKKETVSVDRKEPVSKEERKEPVENAENAETETTSTQTENSCEKEENVSYDVAREVACAQMVWLVPQSVDQQTVEQDVCVEVIADAVQGETAETEVLVVGQEPFAAQEDGVLMPEEMVQQETDVQPQQNVERPLTEVSEQTEVETTEQLNEDTEMPEFKVQDKQTDGNEVAEEAAVSEKPLFHEVEAAPIKVAETPGEAQEASNINEQISQKLDTALKNGETKIEILLEPEALGKVSIEMTHRADGTLSVLLHAENSQTRGLLERNMGGLQEALGLRGQQSVEIEVSRGEETEQQNQQPDLKDGGQENHPQRQRRQQEHSSEDFLQQLRLGLIPMEDFN